MYEIYEKPSNPGGTARLRSSTSQDTANGSAISGDISLQPETTTTLPNVLYLTGKGEYVTLEVVSFSGFAFDVELESITSIKET